MVKRFRRRERLKEHAESVEKAREKRKEILRRRTTGRPSIDRRPPRPKWVNAARGAPQPNEYRSSFREQSPETLRVGHTFSLVHTPEATVRLLAGIVSKLKFMKKLHLDVSQVRSITIDTLLYLLANIDRLKQLGIPVAIGGNVPKDQAANRIFRESGFFNFVASKAGVGIAKSDDTFQIREGHEADPQVAKELCLFAQKQLGLHRTQTKFLFDIVMEIIINTRQHAYQEEAKDHVVRKWYSYATFDRNEREVVFSILDTGQGIPATVRKGWKVEVAQFLQRLGLGSQLSRDEWLITSTLDGAFRTKTGEKHRGKGLPKIHGYFKEGKISDLTIISNKGFVSLKDNRKIELDIPLIGTLYTWRLRSADQRSEAIH